MLKSLASDCLVLLGLSGITYGVALYSRPAGFIFAGLALFLVGVLLGYAPVAKRRHPWQS